MRYALLKVSLVALGISSWVFWSFVFATRPETAVGTNADALESLVRLPASLPAQLPELVAGQSARVNDAIEMNVVSVPCWEKSSTASLATSARWVRLTGRNCGTDVNADSVSVRNLTNGYGATVFATQNKNLTTDFIPLQSGLNNIVIRFDQGEGASLESQLSFIRSGTSVE